MLHRENVVWIHSEQAWGRIVGAMGAFFTTIAYQKFGVDYEVLMENDEFDVVDDIFEFMEDVVERDDE